MNRFPIVLVLAIAALTGCTATSYKGRTAAFEGSLWGQNSSVELARVDVQQERLRIAAQNGGCVQETRFNTDSGAMETSFVTTGNSLCGNMGYGGFGGAGYGPAAFDPMAPYVLAAQRDGMLRTAAGSESSVLGGGSDAGATLGRIEGKVDALGKRVGTIEEAHAPASDPPPRDPPAK